MPKEDTVKFQFIYKLIIHTYETNHNIFQRVFDAFRVFVCAGL